MAQSVQPDHILLWIYEPELALLPDEVKRLQNEVFQIKTVNKNLRSFTKLIPSFKLFPDAFIATADDDTHYPRGWLEALSDNIEINKKIAVGHQARIILVDKDEKLPPYNNWEVSKNHTAIAKNIFLLTGPGVLFPPNSLPTEAFNDEKFLSICATADDVWFYFMLRLNGYQSKKIEGDSKLYTWKGSQKVGLYHVNVYENMNDVCIQNMINEYGNPLTL